MSSRWSAVVCLAIFVAATNAGSIYSFNDKVNFKSGSAIRRLPPVDQHPLLSRPNPISRTKRSDEQHLVTECMYMTSDEGEFYHRADFVNNTCGVYIFTEPDEYVELHMNFMEVSCEKEGRIIFLDGWELNGQVFPIPEDHPKPMSARTVEFCGRRKIKEAFRSSQNAAMLLYRMPERASGFSFSVQFIKNPRPCNVLLQNTQSVFTLRNYGNRSNCSIAALFPAAVSVEALSVGVVPSVGRGVEIETGTVHKCDKRGLEDYVQIGGSHGLDNSRMELADAVCGISSKPSYRPELVLCGTTSVRLVSSGAFENSATINIRQMVEEDAIFNMSVTCPADF